MISPSNAVLYTRHCREGNLYKRNNLKDQVSRNFTGMTTAIADVADGYNNRLDSEVVKLYYSILSSHKKASVQDIRNRRLISAPAPPLSVLAGSKQRPRTPFFETRESPINKGRATPSLVKYVYLSQSKPRPMDPLKAWKGYNGNLYFEPIRINSLASSGRGTQFPAITSNLNTNNKTFISRASWDDAYQHPAVRFEREALLSRLSMSLPDDDLIGRDQSMTGDQSIGTLQLASSARPQKTKSTKKSHIYKGSMVHQLQLKAEKWKQDNRKSAYGYTSESISTPSSAKTKLMTERKSLPR